MKRVQYHRYGGSAELRMMTGRSFPRGLGHDFSGVIEAVGAQVTRFKVGDAVFGAVGLKEAGTFAEALVTDEHLVYPRPLSFEAAAALPLVSATAWFALVERAKLQAGQRVFINGCLGGVRRLAVQIARRRGAAVAGSCSAARRDEARVPGVQDVLDDRTFDAAHHRGRFDVVFDTHGSLPLRGSAALLSPGGVNLDIVPTPLKMIRSLFSPRYQTVMSKITPQMMDGITQGAEQGHITPMIGRTVPLSAAIPALAELERTPSPLGKLVIAPMGG